jgi:hypothetical protein
MSETPEAPSSGNGSVRLAIRNDEVRSGRETQDTHLNLDVAEPAEGGGKRSQFKQGIRIVEFGSLSF